MKTAATVELQADGWWAKCKLGEDTILGHGSAREAALEDLEHQVDHFVVFLKSMGLPPPEGLS